MIVGIDPSKRSTGVVAIDMEGNLIDFLLINNDKFDQEALLFYQWVELYHFLWHYKGLLKGIAIEGLSFNSVGSGKDVLAGLHWVFRTNLYEHFSSVPVGSVPVLSWRSKLLTKEERKVVSSFKQKDYIKKFTVEKLPFEVRAKFEQYVREKGVKKEALWDLCDAWGIAQYRLSLEED